MTRFYQLSFIETYDDYKNSYTEYDVYEPEEDIDKCISHAIELVMENEGRYYQLLERDEETPVSWIKEFIQEGSMPFTIKEEYRSSPELLNLLHKNTSKGEFVRQTWNYKIHIWHLPTDDNSPNSP